MAGPGTVNDDLTFEVKAPPGRDTIGVRLPSAWSQKSVRVNGVDVTDAGIDLKPSETVSGIEIEVTNITTTLWGVVTDRRGQLSRDYVLLVFPQDRDRWPTYRFSRGTRPDQDGRYKITALRPGQYYAVALEPAEGSESSDPDLLERIVTRATPFSLGEGETRTLDLRLTTRP
jgi:hypothetical protein